MSKNKNTEINDIPLTEEEIIKALPEGLPFYKVYSMEEAVETAARLAKDGDTVLLSPAATSYDRYKSFEERGEDFKLNVIKYWEKHSQTG